MTSDVQVEVSDRVMTITLDRPAKLNAITGEMNRALFAAFDEAAGRDNVHVVLLVASGRAFSAGADLAMAAAGGDSRRDAPGDMVKNRARVRELLALWSFPKPFVVGVQGYCLGIATEIVACADLVVCAEGARFGQPEVRDIALPPTIAFWPRSIGLARTKDLLFTGRLMTGSEAVTAGFAARVVPDDELAATVASIAEHVAAVPVDRLSVIKQAVNSWVESDLPAAALRGAEYHALYHQTSEPITPR